MRERFDFSSVSRYILDNRKAESFTHVQYFQRLFDYAFSLNGINEPSETNISKIIKGQRNVPREIANVYQEEQNFPYLKGDVSLLLEDIFDLPLLIKGLSDLLMDDDTLSIEQRKAIHAKKEDRALFIAECVRSSAIRGSLAKTTGHRKNDLLLADYLEDYHIPRTKKLFVGRSFELTAIHDLLKQEDCLFLQGIGGIGKSELAKHYGKQYRQEYCNVLYLHYSESLFQTIVEMDFIDDTAAMGDTERFKSHYRLFQRFQKDTLVILDNFDRLPEEDELLLEFAALAFRLLITTRNTIADFSCYQVTEIASMEALQELFYTYAPSGQRNPEVTGDIVNEVYRHTLTVEMAAKTMNAADLTPEELLTELQRDRLSLSSPNKIRVAKDNRIKKSTPKEHLARLFQMQYLSLEQQSILQHVRLMPVAGISKKLFGKWLEAADFNQINRLIDYGWISEEIETRRISIHPVLSDVLGIFDTPSFKKCNTFIQNIEQEYVAAKEAEVGHRDLLGVTRSMLKAIEVDDRSAAFSSFEKALIYLGKYLYYHTMNEVLDLMEEKFPFDAKHGLETATYHYYRNIVAWWYGDWNTCREHLENGIAEVTPIDESNIKLAIDLYNRYSRYCIVTNNKKRYLEAAKMVVELRERYGVAEPLDAEMERASLKIASMMNETGEQTFDINALLDTPEIGGFVKVVRELGTEPIRKNEFLSDIRKMEPDEFPAEVGSILQAVIGEMELSLSEQQDEIGFPEFMEGMLESIVRVSDKIKPRQP